MADLENLYIQNRFWNLERLFPQKQLHNEPESVNDKEENYKS